jgi:uncharacterized protein DUF5989
MAFGFSGTPRENDQIWNTSSEQGGVMANSGMAGELWAFMRARKKWWLVPIIVMMILVGALLIFAQGSVLAPFIYTIF